MSAVVECLARFYQLVLLVVNAFVALLGLSVMIIGAWAKDASRQYFTIADDNTVYTQVSTLLIVVGIFVLIIGVVGAVGALFASKVFGRVILMIYAISLVLLVICEIAGGIAAAVARDKVEKTFISSANSTFQHYNSSKDSSERDTWNQFQEDFECCGVTNYRDYHDVFHNDKVPISCCNREKTTKTVNCTTAISNSTKYSEYIYQDGCADAIIDSIRKNLGAIAGSVIFFALLQIIGIILACCVAIYKKEKTYEVV